jgi:hypothetical protein
MKDPKPSIDARTVLAFLVTIVSIAGVIWLSIVIIQTADATITDRAQTVFNAVLPLLGTWVGTILAFYFAKDNFEAASRSTERLVRMTPQDQLQSTPVMAAMVSKNRMFFKDDPAAKLVDVLAELTDKEMKRLPVLDTAGLVASLVYREGLIDYLYRVKGGSTEEERKNLTLQNLLSDSPDLQRPFAVIGEGENLAKAKEAMEKIPNCRDVFVTKSGNRSDVVVGLLTDVDIAKYARV